MRRQEAGAPPRTPSRNTGSGHLISRRTANDSPLFAGCGSPAKGSDVRSRSARFSLAFHAPCSPREPALAHPPPQDGPARSQGPASCPLNTPREALPPDPSSTTYQVSRVFRPRAGSLLPRPVCTGPAAGSTAASSKLFKSSAVSEPRFFHPLPPCAGRPARGPPALSRGSAKQRPCLRLRPRGGLDTPARGHEGPFSRQCDRDAVTAPGGGTKMT